MGGKREGEGNGSEILKRTEAKEERGEGQTKVEEPQGPQTTGTKRRISGSYGGKTPVQGIRGWWLRTNSSLW